MQTVSIFRGTDHLADVHPDENSVQIKAVMGDNIVNLAFAENHHIPFAIGDWCIVFGERYQLNARPTIKKVSRFRWEYSLRLEAEAYDLTKAQYMDYGPDNTLTEPDFSLMGTAADFVGHIIKNMARVDSGWSIGQVIPTGYKPLTFSKLNCYNALGQIAQAFDTEFWIVGKTIHLTKRSVDVGRKFRHGKGGGLYDLTRIPMDGTSVITRLYVYGAERNLPPSYPSKRLMLPGVVTDGAGQYGFKNIEWFTSEVSGGMFTTFSFLPPTGPNINALSISYSGPGGSGNSTAGNTTPRSITLPASAWYDIRFTVHVMGGTSYTTEPFRITANAAGVGLQGDPPRVPYIEKNILQYGAIEGIKVFDDIYPRRTGKVTAVDATNIMRFRDNTLDFDINGQLMPGIAAKVTFQTGELAGYTFDIESYDAGSKWIQVLKNRDEKAIDVPSELLRPQIGDEYVLHDIIMPQTYIDAAEEDLAAKAALMMDSISIDQEKYGFNFDPTVLRRIKYVPRTGDLIWISDDDLGVNRRIRITSTTRNIVNEHEVAVEVADTIQFNTVERIVSGQNINTQDIQNLQRFVANRDILNNKASLRGISDTTDYVPVYIHKMTGELVRKV